jgi:nucleotidyltransferase substrate binding protein (TIGR01987 family)
MKSDIRWIQRFENFEKAFSKLSSINSKLELNEFEKMALLQAFEYTFELAWKTMKDFLYENGFRTASPKETIRQAFNAGYISEGDVWMRAIQKRNESSHAYNDEILESTTEFITNEFYQVANKFYSDFKMKINL